MFGEPNGEHFKAFHQSNPLWKMFEPFLLVHNHRQGEGGKWTEALNRFRDGSFTEDDLETGCIYCVYLTINNLSLLQKSSYN